MMSSTFLQQKYNVILLYIGMELMVDLGADLAYLYALVPIEFIFEKKKFHSNSSPTFAPTKFCKD